MSENKDSVRRASPKVCAIIPVFNRWHETQISLDSLSGSDYPNLDVVVVDSGSTDGTSENIKKYEVTYLRISDKFWWAGAMNAGIRHALDNGADYILVYDCGTAVLPDTVSKMVGVASRDPRSLLAAALINSETRRIRWAGKTLHWLFPLYRYNLNNKHVQIKEEGGSKLVPTDTVFGRVALINSASINEVGLFRDDIFPHYHADIEWALRAQKRGFWLYVQIDALAEEFHVPQVSAKVLRRDTYLSRKSDVNFKDTWAFFKYCCPYKEAYPILFIAFYVEFLSCSVRAAAGGFVKRVLSRKMVSRIENNRRNKKIIESGMSSRGIEDTRRSPHKK